MTLLMTDQHRYFARRSSRHSISTPAQSQGQSAVPRIAATRATTDSETQCPHTDGYREQAYRTRPAPFAASLTPKAALRPSALGRLQTVASSRLCPAIIGRCSCGNRSV
jgi:hypothetical protein